MPQNEFKSFATFETLITPKIITALYWVVTIILIIADVVSAANQNYGTAFIYSIALISTRVIFELVMVSFKNNEYLRRMCEIAEAKKGE